MPTSISARLLIVALGASGAFLAASPASADTNTFQDSVGEEGATSAIDITQFRVSLDATTLSVTVAFQSWDDSTISAAFVHIVLDTDLDGESAEFSMTKLADQPNAQLYSAAADNGVVPGCPVTTTTAPPQHAVTTSVPASCIGSPSGVRVSIEVEAGNAGFDAAPEMAWFTRVIGAGPTVGLDLPIAYVHRFWSPGYDNAHFFTMDETEALAVLSFDTSWRYEGVAFAAYAAPGGSCPGATPVYRFYSPGFRSHFYTSNATEMQQVRQRDTNWAYEGIAYCASSTPVDGTVALHRFWSSRFGKHFYTADTAEADHLRTADANWSYEGIAFYVLRVAP